MVKLFKKSSSPELRMPWGWICAQIIRDRRSTKVAKKIVVRWHLTFLQKGQVCFPMHLYESHNIYMGKLLWISDNFSSEATEPNLLKFLAHLSMKCSWWAIVVSQYLSSVMGRVSCVMRQAASTIALKAYSSYVPGPIDSIHGRKCRSKIAKIVPKSKLAAMAAILKIYFSLLLLNRKANWLQTC